MADIKKLIQCPICLDTIDNPKMLPCQHTYCFEPCLKNMAAASTPAKNVVQCAICRKEFDIPQNDLNNFPTNITVASLIDIESKSAINSNNTSSSNKNNSTKSDCSAEFSNSKAHHSENKYFNCSMYELEISNEILPKLEQRKVLYEQKLEKNGKVYEEIKQEITDEFDALLESMRKRKDCLLVEALALNEAQRYTYGTKKIELDLEIKHLREVLKNMTSGKFTISSSELEEIKRKYLSDFESSLIQDEDSNKNELFNNFEKNAIRGLIRCYGSLKQPQNASQSQFTTRAQNRFSNQSSFDINNNNLPPLNQFNKMSVNSYFSQNEQPKLFNSNKFTNNSTTVPKYFNADNLPPFSAVNRAFTATTPINPPTRFETMNYPSLIDTSELPSFFGFSPNRFSGASNTTTTDVNNSLFDRYL